MEWKTHISLGVLFGLVTYVVLHKKIPAEVNFIDFLVWTAFFSIAPDFDVIIGHRSEYTHSLLGVLVGFIIGLILKRELLWALIAAAAVFSHIFGDSLTREGIPFFYPFSQRKHAHFPYLGARLRYDNKYANKTIQIVGVVLIVGIFLWGVYEGNLESAIVKRAIEYLISS